MAAMHPIVTLITLLLQTIQEDIIAEASLGILSVKGALTALVPEATHGTDPNAYPSLLQAIQAEATIAIIHLPAHISTVALRGIIGTAADV